MNKNKNLFMWRVRSRNPRTLTWGILGTRHGLVHARCLASAEKEVRKKLSGDYLLEFYVPRSDFVK